MPGGQRAPSPPPPQHSRSSPAGFGASPRAGHPLPGPGVCRGERPAPARLRRAQNGGGGPSAPLSAPLPSPRRAPRRRRGPRRPRQGAGRGGAGRGGPGLPPPPLLLLLLPAALAGRRQRERAAAEVKRGRQRWAGLWGAVGWGPRTVPAAPRHKLAAGAPGLRPRARRGCSPQTKGRPGAATDRDPAAGAAAGCPRSAGCRRSCAALSSAGIPARCRCPGSGCARG